VNRVSHLREAAEALVAAITDSPYEGTTYHRGFVEGYELGEGRHRIMPGPLRDPVERDYSFLDEPESAA
jgi:hypothetical protein